jgi:hypothetical protein
MGQAVTFNTNVLKYVLNSMMTKCHNIIQFDSLLSVCSHSPPTAGHLGINKTFARLREIFFWKGMWQDVQQFVNSCIACSSVKPRNGTTPGLLQPIPVLA